MYYSTQADVLYCVSAVILWAFAEMTCGFLVIGIPIVPKFLFETGIITFVKTSMKSWTGKASASKNSSNSTASSHTLTKAPNPNSLYRKIDGEGVPLENLKMPTSESTEELRDSGNDAEAAVVRTTRVSTMEDFDDEARDEHFRRQFERQHPWRNKQGW